MEITKMYHPREVNWFLIPELLRRANASIPDDRRVDDLFHLKLHPTPRFTIKTYSQLTEVESGEDFLDFLKSSLEAPTRVEPRLDCYMEHKDGSHIERDPAFFRFVWCEDELKVEISRNSSESALKFLDEFEKALQLEPLRLEEQYVEQETEERLLLRTVFIAHSFDQIGRSYAYQLTKFLSLLGFEVATGEGFSPEKVSSKVKRRLLAQQIVIAIVSEREEFTWLIQEMTGATFTEKPLFVLVEEGADFKSGVLGDLEYIRFEKSRIADSFTPIVGGLRELGFQFS